MRLRSYLRGLGIGIIVTALLMGISIKEPEMSDDEIIAKAKQLGMVESTTLAEDAQKQLEQLEEDKSEETVSEEIKIEEKAEDPLEEAVPDDVTTEEISEEEISEEDKTEEDSTKEDEEQQLEDKLEEELLGIRETGDDEEIPEELEEPVTTVPEEETEGGEIIRLEIRSGDTSVSVSKRLVELGLVENATEYDQYLCQNGYDKRICTGTYEIITGATYEEIAKIITKQN